MHAVLMQKRVIEIFVGEGEDVQYFDGWAEGYGWKSPYSDSIMFSDVGLWEVSNEKVIVGL